jgi:phosphatidylserine/phosphatidylglycerophosphate/cardiolipin synthase-like enzyme
VKPDLRVKLEPLAAAKSAIRALSRAEREALSDDLQTRKLAPPFVQAVLGSRYSAAVGRALDALVDAGLPATQLPVLLFFTENDRPPLPSLVATAPAGVDRRMRATNEVLRDLLGRAESEILILGYTFEDFQENLPDLRRPRQSGMPRLQIVTSVKRGRSQEPADVLVERTAARLRHSLERLTAQSSDGDTAPLAAAEGYLFTASAAPFEANVFHPSMHAKVVVADRRRLLIGSANFTASARFRNVEIGVLFENADLANDVYALVDGLRTAGALHRV